MSSNCELHIDFEAVGTEWPDTDCDIGAPENPYSIEIQLQSLLPVPDHYQNVIPIERTVFFHITIAKIHRAGSAEVLQFPHASMLWNMKQREALAHGYLFLEWAAFVAAFAAACANCWTMPLQQSVYHARCRNQLKAGDKQRHLDVIMTLMTNIDRLFV